MKKIFTLFFLTISIFAISQKVKYSNEFLSIGVGARALGLSGAVVANSQDIYSTYWNPASLTDLKFDRNIAGMHSEYFAGIAKYDYGAFAAKFDNSSVLGLSMIRFGVDDIPNTSQLIDSEGNINYANVTSFSATDLAIIVSYAKKLKITGLSIGGNAKIIRRKVGDFAGSWGFGIDLSAKYTKNNWIFGANFRDITTTFNAWTYNFSDKMKEVYTLTGNDIPQNTLEITMPKFILGAAHPFLITKDINLTPEIDIEISTDGKRNVLINSDFANIDPKIGLELNYKKIIYLRSGIGNIQKETNSEGKIHTTVQPNIGLGISINEALKIDYAFTDIGNSSIALYSHIFSLSYSFNRKKEL